MCIFILATGSVWYIGICHISRNEGQKFTATSLAQDLFEAVLVKLEMKRSVVLGDLQLANKDRSLEFTWQ